MSKNFCIFVAMKGFLKFLWDTGNIVELIILLGLAVLFIVITSKEGLAAFTFAYVVILIMIVINKWLLYKKQ